MDTLDLANPAALAPPDEVVDGAPVAVADTAPPTPEQLAEQAAAAEAAEREAQLQRLLQRMQQHADFPSLRDSIHSIRGVARSETAHLRALTDQVLGDVALTNKLLRMINTAFYSSVGGGTIDSLARAVALMGFAPVAMLASSLSLFDRLPKGPDGARVQKEFGRALLAAMLANQFCPVRKLEESAYVTALFQNLGTMLAWMHFPLEAAEVEAIVAQAEPPDQAALQAASRKVLGISYDDLALEVARSWGWPEGLQQSLRRLEPADPEIAATRDDYLRVVCTSANRLAAELEHIDSPPALERCLADFSARYAVPISFAEADLAPMVERARGQWADLALILGFARLQPRAAARPARQADPQASRPGRAPAIAATPATPPRRPAAPRRSNPAVAVALSAALGAISQRAMSDAPIADVMRLLMDQLRDAMGLQRVIVCLQDQASGELVGRHGIGERSASLIAHFRVPMQPPTDLFGLLCSRHADTLISDTTDPVIVKRLPGWFRQQVRAPCFVLLPLALGEKPIGLIYGDRSDANSLSIDDNELTLLKALRNQLVMAMRLRGISG